MQTTRAIKCRTSHTDRHTYTLAQAMEVNTKAVHKPTKTTEGHMKVINRLKKDLNEEIQELKATIEINSLSISRTL